MLVETSKQDVRSVTGRNLREIMILLGKTSVNDVNKKDVEEIEYFPIDPAEKWKVNAIKEIIDVKNGVADIENFELEELETILIHICTA